MRAETALKKLKVTPAERRRAIRRFYEGLSMAMVAAEHGLTRSLVEHIIREDAVRRAGEHRRGG